MKRPEIPNWTTDVEAAELARLAAGRLVLEIGTFQGFGAVLMAQAGATVWAVDWHRGGGELGERDTLRPWWTNVRRHQMEDRIVGVVGRSEDVLPFLGEHVFDMAFVDGDHSEEGAYSDLEWASRLVRSGGVIVAHDYCEVWPSVVRAVDRFSAAIGSPVRRLGSLAIIDNVLER